MPLQRVIYVGILSVFWLFTAWYFASVLDLRLEILKVEQSGQAWGAGGGVADVPHDRRGGTALKILNNTSEKTLESSKFSCLFAENT